ncbi:MAG TPA: ABC transporter permease [Candidatus Angelobacter sp.]|nr:ABC transporter permease [Candidatus Angelobacter sp.]
MSLFSRVAATFRRNKKDDDLEEELRSHREMRARDNVNAGMSEQEADLDALRRFGNSASIQESTRSAHIVLWLETVLQDARFGLRMLSRTPGFTIVAVLTVALTIGATAAVFAVINSVLLRPLPYENPERLIVIATFMPRESSEVTASPHYVAFKTNSRILEDAGAYSPEDYNVSGAGEPERLHGVVATASFFSTLAVHPALGRVFTVEEDMPGAEKVVVISHSFWQRHFNSDTGVVGKTILLDSVPHVVIGVLRSSFRFPDSDLQPELIVPAAMPTNNGDANQPMLIVSVIGRMKRGVSLEHAQSDLENVFQQYLASMNSKFGAFFEGASVHTRLLETELVGPVRRPLLIIMTAVGFVLLIGCLNIASLQLARAVQRSQEVGVRSALGAGKLRLLRQLITENLVLSGCGSFGGLLIAVVAASLVRAAKLSALPHVAEIRVDFWVLGFIALITLAAGLFFGVAPALWVNGTDPAEAIAKGNRSTASTKHRRLRNLLVIAELAVALILLAGAGLLVRSFSRLLAVDPGFDFHNVLTARISFPLSSLRQQESRFAFLDQVTQELRALPSVESVGTTNSLPLLPYENSLSVVIEGKPAPPKGMSPFVPLLQINPDYFHAMKIATMAGRSFNNSDTRTSAPVAIVNQAFARRFFPGEAALGKRFRVPAPSGPPPALTTIVGVVGDVHHLGLAQNASPEVYSPLAQSRIYDGVTFVIRTSQMESTSAALRRIIAKLDSNQPVSDVTSMEQKLSASLSARKVNMVSLGAFALLALVLSAVGIFGVLSYSVAQRSHEIGVRMALGSDRERVVKLVLREAAWLSVTGALCGTAGALALTRFMSSLLYHTSAFDPLTMICVSALLIAVGILAGYVPAHRASRVDPMIALRAE